MITASHNPFYDNGIKFFDNSGRKLNSDSEREIESIFNDMDRIEESFCNKKGYRTI